MTTLSHVTLNTGHVRDSHASEVDPLIMATVRGLVQKLLRKQLGHPVVIPGIKGYLINGQSRGSDLIATVWHNIDTPIATIGSAPSGRSEVWSLLHQGRPELKTSATNPPSGPWVAVRLEYGIVEAMSATSWLGDFERCLGHAWMETLVTGN